jgi:regulator of sigma E protease
MLGVLVFFHEWGHFIAAKLSGIRVEEFAFGFGPKLARVLKRGETEYTIHAVPLGGFVKLTGMEPGEEDVDGGFQAQAIWKRAVVIFAGPLFSFILGAAVLLFVGVHWGFPDNTVEPRIGLVQPSTVAATIGLRAGDRVKEINGVKITSGIQMTDMIHTRPGRNVTLLVKRDGRTLTKTGRPRYLISYLGTDWSFVKKGDVAVAGTVPKQSPAANAGIEPDDELISIDSQPIATGREMLAAIKASNNRPVRLKLNRSGETISVTVKPDVQWVSFAGLKWFFPGAYAELERGAKAPAAIKELDRLVGIDDEKITSGEDMVKAIEKANGHEITLAIERGQEDKPIRVTLNPGPVQSGNYTAIGLLGFVPAQHLVKTGFGDSMKQGFRNITGMLAMLMETLTHSDRIKKDIGGPVMIFKATQVSVALGASHVFWLLGSLSLGLAVVNLIPIPAVLDGGHLLLLGIEAVRRRRWSRTQMQAMQMVGLAMVAVLIVLILYSDINKIATGQVFQ